MFKKSMIVACLLTIMTIQSSFAFGPGGDKNFRNEIKTLLSKSAFNSSDAETIFVDFLVNKKGEIIVVGTNDEENDNVVRGTLHMHKLKSKDYEVNKMYTLPIVVAKR
ncbi:MAG: hypothetical protein KDC49_13445 [Saprospiraceae bacterium]|nr:hypothetical protein [Saprospiraceae bacterium]